MYDIGVSAIRTRLLWGGTLGNFNISLMVLIEVTNQPLNLKSYFPVPQNYNPVMFRETPLSLH